MSHFQTAGQAAYSVSKHAALLHGLAKQMNGTIAKKRANCKTQKLSQFQKRLLSSGATGWMLDFRVRNTNCLLNNMH